MNVRITSIMLAIMLIAGMAVLSNCSLPTEEGDQASMVALERAVGPGSQVVQVAAGACYSMAIVRDSQGKQTLWVIGSNSIGQLGVNNRKNCTTWKNSGLNNVTLVARGTNHSLCVADNRLYVTGLNDVKQLGISVSNGKNYIDKWQQTVFGDITALACGYNHSMFVSRNCLWVAGSNGYGQLGLGPAANSVYWQPTQSNAVSQIACGENHSMYIGDNNKNLYVTGQNKTGQLGLGYSSPKVTQWTKVPNINSWNITAVACGNAHSMIKAYGPLLSNPGIVSDWIWVTGSNDYTQIGPPSTMYVAWEQLPYGNIGLIACGFQHSMFTSGGNLWTTGDNRWGQLGIGNVTISNGWQPTQYGNIYNGISAGYSHSLFISQGQTWGAGSNRYLELGVEGYKNRSSYWFLQN
jgi:alpha-tubulin suppressor-like RCC1 family protein